MSPVEGRGGSLILQMVRSGVFADQSLLSMCFHRGAALTSATAFACVPSGVRECSAGAQAAGVERGTLISVGHKRKEEKEGRTAGELLVSEQGLKHPLP